MKRQVLLTGLFAGLSLLAFVLAMAFLGIPAENYSGHRFGSALVRIFLSDSDSFPPETYGVRPGLSLRDVLSEHYKISESFSLIKCLDDVCAAGGNVWHISLNGKLLSASPLDYVLRPGDIVDVRYGRFASNS